MSWESRYLPPDPLAWQGRSDVPPGACFFQHITPLNLLSHKHFESSPIAFAILGFKCDEGTQRDLGRTGAVEGPVAIRQRLARLPIQKKDIICYDAGDIVCMDHDLEASQQALGEVTAILLKHQIRPIIIGGGHETAWGHYQGIAKTYPPEMDLGIINVDAHFDLHPMHPSNRGSTTTAFTQIAEAHQKEGRRLDYNCLGIQHAGNISQSFDAARQLNAKYILAEELHRGLQEKYVDFVDRVIDENELIYMSLSMDVFSPAFAPGVSATQPLGVTPWHLIPLIRQIAASGKVVSYDICEVVPRYDIDHRTAKLAATLIYEIIHHHNEQPLTA